MVRCIGTHNRVALTDELQDCAHGFYVQITITEVIPVHAIDVTRWCSQAGQLMHLDYQYCTGDLHQFVVGVAHGLTLLASSTTPCWGDRFFFLPCRARHDSSDGRSFWKTTKVISKT